MEQDFDRGGQAPPAGAGLPVGAGGLSQPPAEELLVDVVVEIPQGTRNKYEYDPVNKVMRLDRVLYTAMHYPGDYGFVPDTLAEDGDAMDVVVLISSPTFPGCRVSARVVGALLMEDQKEVDIKLLGVAVGDPRLQQIRSLEDVAPHLLAEVEHFFQAYKHLERKETSTFGWRDQAYARQKLEEARIRFSQ